MLLLISLPGANAFAAAEGLTDAESGSTLPGVALDAMFDHPLAFRAGHPDILRGEIDASGQVASSTALHLTVDTSLGELDGTGVPHREKQPFLVMQLPDEFDLSRFTHVRCRVLVRGGQNIYFRMGFVNKGGSWSRGPIYLPGVGGPTINAPMTRGRWQTITIPVGHYPEEDLKQCNWLVLKAVLVGHRPDDPAVTEVWLDDFTGSDEPMRHHRGWQIDPTVVALPQTGFVPLAEKMGLVAASNPATSFKVVDVEASDRRVVYAGRLQTVRSRIGTTKVADFSALIEPGRYQVEAVEVKSLPFRIGEDVWDAVTEPMSDWILTRRVGVPTAVSSKAYHLDDALYVDWVKDEESGEYEAKSRHPIDVVGGWYDAGDVRSFFHYAAEMPASAMICRQVGYTADRDGDGVDDMTDKALFALKHLVKLQNPVTGELLTSIEHQSATRARGLRGDAPKAAGDYWTDNVKGNHDDRLVTSHFWVITMMNRAAESVGMFARMQGEAHPEITAAALELIEQRWDHWFGNDAKNLREKYGRWYGDWEQTPSGHIARNWSFFGMGSLQLYLATGKPKYLQFARTCADMVMRAQQKHFYSEAQITGEIFEGFGFNEQNRYAPQQFLADLCIELPNDPNYAKWRLALLRSSEWLMKPTRAMWAPFSPQHIEVPAKEFNKGQDFGVLVDRNGRKPATYLCPWTHLTEYPIYAMRRVAQALDDPELERLARDQVRWVVGYNPFNVSWIHGVGQDHVTQFYQFGLPATVGEYGGSVGMGKYTGLPRSQRGNPGVVRPEGPEPWVKPAERYLRAAITVSRPASVVVQLRQSDEPFQGRFVLRWTRTGQLVRQGQTDASGMITLTLAGGQSYELLIDGKVIPLRTISGVTQQIALDLDQLVLATASGPSEVLVGAAFDVMAKLHHLGDEKGGKAVTVPLTVHVDGAKLVQPDPGRDVVIKPGEMRTVTWRLQASHDREPYVASIHLPGVRPSWVDVTGAIR